MLLEQGANKEAAAKVWRDMTRRGLGRALGAWLMWRCDDVKVA